MTNIDVVAKSAEDFQYQHKSVRVQMEGYIKANSMPIELYLSKSQQLDDMIINNDVARSYAKEVASELAGYVISCRALGKKNADLSALIEQLNDKLQHHEEIVQELYERIEKLRMELAKIQAKVKRRRR